MDDNRLVSDIKHRPESSDEVKSSPLNAIDWQMRAGVGIAWQPIHVQRFT